jgi:hypothetical protein
MSFDIEASSSHGDFPVPVKSYKKLATNIVDYFQNSINNIILTPTLCKNILINIIKTAFELTEKQEEKLNNIDIVYPQEKIKNINQLQQMIDIWLTMLVRDYRKSHGSEEYNIEAYFEKEKESLDDGLNELNNEDNEEFIKEEKHYTKSKGILNINNKSINKTNTIIDVICDNNLDRDVKINELIL